MAKPGDAINARQRPDIHLRRIAEALTMLDNSPWKYLLWVCNDTNVILHDELVKKAAAITAGISIETGNAIRLRGCDLTARHLAARATYNGEPLHGIHLLFSSDRLSFGPATITDQAGNCHATITGFKPRTGRIMVTAALDIGDSANVLVAAGVAMPAASSLDRKSVV